MLLYRLAFSMLKGLNVALGSRMLSLTGSEENFFNARESALSALIGSRSAILSDKVRKETLEKARRELDFIENNKVKAVYFTDPEYPQRLRECEDAPLMLYVCGDCDLNTAHVVSIVGTRHATPYGIAFINDVVKELAERIDNILIVSGLAYGADIAAHRAALNASVPTVGVVAHGLSTLYPAAHRSDAASMIRSGGALVTEYTHDAQIHRGNFLSRNRIVAGMADCLVVAESAEKGGALVTARIAAGYGRDVFALPGRSSDIYSRGCNTLIRRNMAALVESADDIIEAMRWQAKPKEGEQALLFEELPPEQQAVVDYLREKGEARINSISVDTGMNIGRLMSVLVDLEFKGRILNFPGGLYRLT